MEKVGNYTHAYSEAVGLSRKRNKRRHWMSVNDNYII